MFGDINVEGTIIGGCTALELLGRQDISITGTLDIECKSTTDTLGAGDLVIQTTSGTIALGDPDARRLAGPGLGRAATLITDGNLSVTNDPTLEDWEFDVLPGQRSETPLAPVVSASADTLVDTIVPGFPIEVAFSAEALDPDGGPVLAAFGKVVDTFFK